MTDRPIEPRSDAGFQIQKTLEEAISTAIEKARSDAANHPTLGHPACRRPDDYYAQVALHRAFLIACGADVETNTGGDVKKASRILRLGGTMARAWQKEDAGSGGVKLPQNPGPSEDDLRNREELRRSADRLVRDTVIMALMEHVSKQDATFRGRIGAAIEARIPREDSGSEQAELFSEFVRSSTRHLLGETR